METCVEVMLKGLYKIVFVMHHITWINWEIRSINPTLSSLDKVAVVVDNDLLIK